MVQCVTTTQQECHIKAKVGRSLHRVGSGRSRGGGGGGTGGNGTPLSEKKLTF